MTALKIQQSRELRQPIGNMVFRAEIRPPNYAPGATSNNAVLSGLYLEGARLNEDGFLEEQ